MRNSLHDCLKNSSIYTGIYMWRRERAEDPPRECGVYMGLSGNMRQQRGREEGGEMGRVRTTIPTLVKSERTTSPQDPEDYVGMKCIKCFWGNTHLYVRMYVHTCCVLIKPPMPIHYVLAAVFASCFYVLKSLLHE